MWKVWLSTAALTSIRALLNVPIAVIAIRQPLSGSMVASFSGVGSDPQEPKDVWLMAVKAFCWCHDCFDISTAGLAEVLSPIPIARRSRLYCDADIQRRRHGIGNQSAPSFVESHRSLRRVMLHPRR